MAGPSLTLVKYKVKFGCLICSDLRRLLGKHTEAFRGLSGLSLHCRAVERASH